VKRIEAGEEDESFAEDRRQYEKWDEGPGAREICALRKGKAVGSDLNRFFSRMGARVKVANMLPIPWRWSFTRTREEAPLIAIDIRRDNIGEFFEIRTAPGSTQEIVVLNAQPREKHLVLLSRQFDTSGQVQAKQKFLCGRDEKHWFVAAIPENEPVSSVASAKAALKPEAVRERERAWGVSQEESFRRKNVNYVRQGEWFFLPEREVTMNPLLIRRNEPLSRGNGGKAHIAEQCYRTGGETVYVSAKYPTGISAAAYRRLPESERKQGFRTMQRDAAVYVRGAISHRDHKTIELNGWHRVFMNTESRAKAMSFVVFLD
jgi:hypothetical protein